MTRLHDVITNVHAIFCAVRIAISRYASAVTLSTAITKQIAAVNK